MGKHPGHRPWIMPQHEAHAVALLAKQLAVPELVASVLLKRGMTEPQEVADFLAADLRRMPDPRALDDTERAAARLVQALRMGEHITVYGDYDVDGVTSSSLLWLFFKEGLGRELDVYIPHRLSEGYGLNTGAIDRLAAQGTRVLVTVDNGSSAVAEVEHARKLGLDVIIIDHHQVSDPEPAAYAHMNPHRRGCSFDGKQLAAVGVTFMLIVELRRQLREAGFFAGRTEPRPDLYLDMVALGTVADVVPLTGVNRALVRYGLKVIKRKARAGVRALMDRAKVSPEGLSATDVAFRLGPRINAAGRIDDATWGFKLLTGEDRHEAMRLAEMVEQHNKERQAIEKAIADQAVAQVEADPKLSEAPAVILHNEGWHPGVIGIVCSRLVEKFRRPAILLGHDGDTYRGSARSMPGFNLKLALDACSGHLLKYGGHAAAAGLSLEADRFDGFVSAFHAYVTEVTGGERPTYGIEVDALVDLPKLRHADIEAMETLAPFGQSNPMPVLAAKGVNIEGHRMLRGNHLKMKIRTADGLDDAIVWRAGERALPLIEGPVDLLFAAGFDYWQGRRRLTLSVRDIRASKVTDLGHVNEVAS